MRMEAYNGGVLLNLASPTIIGLLRSTHPTTAEFQSFLLGESTRSEIIPLTYE
jgi:hypothetical protein